MDAHIRLVTITGEMRGRLRRSVLDLVSEGEKFALSNHLSKTTAIREIVTECIDEAGYRLIPGGIEALMSSIECIRRGERCAVEAVVDIEKQTRSNYKYNQDGIQLLQEKKMTAPAKSTGSVLSFFEAERLYPNDDARAWYDRLVGLDNQKRQLILELQMLLYPQRLVDWSKKHHHQKILRVCELQCNRVPLVLFEGDVGTGKTALAETIGDAFARRTNQSVRLLKINTQVRGTGQVGEMTDLIVQAFVHAESTARKVAPQAVLLLIDEADALASSRDVSQMHHEDKAGLNTLLQRLDSLRLARLPVAVFFVTNRPEALDSAVRRRAALDLHFPRPTEEIREAIIRTSLPELTISSSDMKALLKITGESDSHNKSICYTSSDLTDRLFPAALREAFAQDRPLTVSDLIDSAKQIEATPRFGVEK
jgi:AAA+ superfamily predicted ATPase